MMQCPQGTDISTYNQPVIDTQRQLRNFRGVEDTTYYSLSEIVNGDYGGSTDSDSGTDPNYNPNYSTINKKKGKVR